MLKMVFCLGALGAFAAPVMAQTAAVPSARMVLAQWRHAAHQGAAPAARTAHLRYGLVQDGLTGTFEQWVTPAGSYREATDRRFDSGAYLLTPRAPTRRDWDGYVRAIEGAEVRRVRTEAATARALAFGPPDTMQSASVGESADQSAWTLAYTAAGASPVIWYIDRASGLPQKTVVQSDGRDLTIAYADWQPGPAGLMPRLITRRDGRSTDRLTVAAAPAYARTGPADFAALRAGPADTAMAAATVDIPFTMAANHIILPVSVNGRPPIGFLFDTGDGDQLINTARMAELGVTPYGAAQLGGGGGVQASAYARDIALTIGGVTLSRQHASTLDLSGLERIFGIRLGGILGYDFIARFVIEIDYSRHIMRLHRPQSFAYRGAAQAIPITIEDGIPYAEGLIGVPTRPHIQAHFLIDFGASDTMILTRPFVQANDLINLAGTSRAVTTTPGAQQFYTQNNSRGRIAEWRLGPAILRDIPVSFSANTSGAYASPDFAGTIGEGIYTRYHAFLDYSRRRLILEPTASTGNPFRERITYGLAILATDDLSGVTTSTVTPNSPAAQQGFQAHDVIVSVDGHAPSVEEVRTRLAAAGHHVFIVRRGDQNITIAADIPAPSS